MTELRRNAMIEHGMVTVGHADEPVRPVIGMLVTYLSDPYTQALIQGAADSAVAGDANLIVYQLDGPASADTELGVYALVDPSLLSGVLLTAGLEYSGDRALEQLAAFRSRCGDIPMHSVSLKLDGVHSVSVDNYTGMRSAVEHLLDHHGLRRIAFVAGPATSSEADARYRAYVDALQSHGLSLDIDLVTEGDFSPAGGARAVIELLDRGVELEAVVCASDDTAVGVLQALELRHIRVPEDLAVVGFDDTEIAKTVSPPLTTVRQPVYEIGRRAVEHLLAVVLKQNVPSASVIPTELVVRRSCGCLPSHVQGLVLAGQVVPPRLVAYDDYRLDIVAALHEIAGEDLRVEAIVDGLWRDLKLPDSSEFVTLVSAQLHHAAARAPDLMVWHAILTKLREMIVPLLGERRLWYRAEDLLQQARSLVDEARLQVLSRRQTLLNRRETIIQEFNARSVHVLSLEDTVSLMPASFPALLVHRCYLSLFGADPASEVQLSVTYCDGSGHFQVGGSSFVASKLLPDSVWATLTDRFTVLALPLYAGDQSLGIAVFEGDLESLETYRRLRQSLSGVIFRAQLVDAQREARRVAEQASANAQLALRDALVAQRQYVEGAWHSHSTTMGGYRWTPKGGAPTRDDWLPVMTDAVRESRLVVAFDENGDQMLGLPLTLLEEEIIGAVGFTREAGEPWTSGQLAQVVTVTNELAQVLERRRLVADVERRASRLAAAAEVSSAASSITELDQLLTTSVNLIRERFDLAYAGIFLVDDRRKWAVLVAGTGDAGQVMLSRGHRLEIGDRSMIGACIAHAVARVTVDTALEDVWLRNPLLPDTRSELALPLISRAEVIGAMTIQDVHAGAFRAEDITTLQTMANQLADAIQNARLMEQLEQNLQEVQMATGRFTASAWRDFVLDRRSALGYRHQILGTSPVADLRPEADAALERGESVLASLVPDGGQEIRNDARVGLGVPIRLRNQILGVLNLRFEDDYVPPETVQLIEQVADRLAVSLETARLLEETQRTAQRERLIGDLSRRIRRSLEVDEVLQGAVREIREAMDLYKVSVRLAPHASPGEAQDSEVLGSGDRNGIDL